MLKENPEFNRGRIGMNARFGLYLSSDDPEGTLLFKKRGTRDVEMPIMVFPSFYEGLKFLSDRTRELGFGQVVEGGKNQPVQIKVDANKMERFLPDGNFVVVDEGRRMGEASLLIVKNGLLRGMAYHDTDDSGYGELLDDPDINFDPFPELRMILTKFIAKNRFDRIVKLP